MFLVKKCDEIRTKCDQHSIKLKYSVEAKLVKCLFIWFMINSGIPDILLQILGLNKSSYICRFILPSLFMGLTSEQRASIRIRPGKSVADLTPNTSSPPQTDPSPIRTKSKSPETMRPNGAGIGGCSEGERWSRRATFRTNGSFRSAVSPFRAAPPDTALIR